MRRLLGHLGELKVDHALETGRVHEPILSSFLELFLYPIGYASLGGGVR